MSATSFISEVRQELKKVDWPTRPEVIKMTALVVIISLIVAFYIGFLDIALAELISRFIQ